MTDKNPNPRSVSQNRMYWSILRLICEYQTVEVFKGDEGPKRLHETLKRAMGVFEDAYDIDGNVIGFKTGSTAFHKKNSPEFTDYLNRVIDYTFAEIVPRLKSEEFENKLLNMLKIWRLEDG